MSLKFFDTHAHIHFSDYGLDAEEVWKSAKDEGVDRMIAVGCKLEDSRLAVDFALVHAGVWASVGIHPHEAEGFLQSKSSKKGFEELLEYKEMNNIIALGECGLDYFYKNSSREKQIEVLEYQLHLAEKHELPVICHVREAYEDFWPVYDKFRIKRAVIHSFTGVQSDVGPILSRNLFIGLNGIVTFTKCQEQLEAVRSIPLERIVLETDAPYLTPVPLRGKICKPEHVKLTAAFVAELRGESLEQLAEAASENAQRLFNIKE